ncbi:MAG: hypothetical protein HKN51_16150 [Saprospiraceae bacterium]|nr:hypothetical protein [Saprospiraceae bacterium]
MEEDETIEEDCSYVFEEGLDHIYGRWEPKVILEYETGDSTYYEEGESHTGFMFGEYYSDAFELRDDGHYVLYYVIINNPCKEDDWGLFEYDNSELHFYLLGDTIRIPVLSVDENELIIEDVINFKKSRATMRRIK